jgi:hypothetical protein
MKRTLKIISILFFTVVVSMQIFQIDKTNPPIVAGETLEAAVSVSPDISIILGRSCNDCHSYKTIYPWYSYVQPVGWWLQSHYSEGRDELNFSKFNTYDPKRKARKLEEMCEEVAAARMPLTSYTYGHPKSILTDSEKEALCSWTVAERSKLRPE